jgi:D-alanine-D-alanine ligase
VLEPLGISCDLVESQEPQGLLRAIGRVDDGVVLLNMTDGFYPVTASYFPAMCAMFGWRYFGNSAALQLGVQNKYLQYAMCRLLGVRAPESFLYDGERCLSETPPPDGEFPFFVKPFDQANSIGIFNEAVLDRLREAVAVAARIKSHYGTKALIQRYVAGDTIRVNYVGAAPERPLTECLGIHRMKGPPEPERPFTDFETHLRDFVQADADYAREAVATPLDPNGGRTDAAAVRQIRREVSAFARQFGLRDIFSMDYKLASSGECYFIEVNTLPFARNAALKAYCRSEFGLSVGAAMARAIVGRHSAEFPKEW